MYKTPLFDALCQYKNENPARFHMPGHKASGLLADFFGDAVSYDVTELPDTDSLYEADGVIMEAEKLAAAIYGTQHTLFGAGGSTLCIQAMLKLAIPMGGKLIAGRNIHRAAVNAFALLDIDPIWVYPEQMEESIFSKRINPFQIRRALMDNSDVSGVYITTPDYYGVMSDISEISAICKEFGIPLLVDNAHGSHLILVEKGRFHPAKLGGSIICESPHKTLPVLTGGAFLHLCSNKYSLEDAKEAMSMFGSSSPSYLIMASLDIARSWMQEQGEAEYQKLIKKVHELSEYANSLGYDSLNGSFTDPTRLSIDTSKNGLTGTDAAKILAKNGVIAELADENCIVFIPTPFNSDEDFIRLKNGITALIGQKSKLQKSEGFIKVQKVMTPRQALCQKYEVVPTPQSVNRIAAQLISRCPPGIPQIIPGERITEQALHNIPNKNIKVVTEL
jgi:arginine decarboxylase